MRPISDNMSGKDTSRFSRGRWLSLKGLLLALLSGVIFSLAGVIVKQLDNINQVELAMCRFIGLFTLSLPQAVHSRMSLFPKGQRFLLLLRGISGASGLLLSFMAYRYMPLGEANVIAFSAPVFVTIVARVCMQEKCGVLQVVALVLTVVGLVLIAGVPFAETSYSIQYVYGLLSAFGALVISTLRFIILRKLKGVHEAVVMFNFGWTAVLEMGALAVLTSDFRAPLCGLQPWKVVGLGVLSYVEQLLLTLAMQFEQAGPVATANAATGIVSAFLWQTLLFRDVPDAWSVGGAVLVSGSVVLVGMRQWIPSLPRDSKLRRCLGR